MSARLARAGAHRLMTPPRAAALRLAPICSACIPLHLMLSYLVSMRPADEACLTRIVAGLPCALCGGTRAVAAILAVDFPRALALNPLVALASVGALAGPVLWAIAPVWPAVGRIGRLAIATPRSRLALTLTALTALLAGWLYQLSVA